jgi:hypothetical protein
MKKTILTLIALAMLPVASQSEVYSFKGFSADFPTKPEVEQHKGYVSHTSFPKPESGKDLLNSHACVVAEYDDSDIDIEALDVTKVKAQIIKRAQESGSTIGNMADAVVQGHRAFYITQVYSEHIRSGLYIFTYPTRYVVSFIVSTRLIAMTRRTLSLGKSFMKSFTLLNDDSAWY